MSSKSDAKLLRRLSLALIVLTLVVFWPVGHHEFVNYDDPDYVTANPQVQAGLTWAGIKWAFGNLHGAATYWHPVTWLSHMLDCQLFGLNATAHHLVNLLFHTVNTVLLFILLARLTGATWRSALVAAFFAIHPLQVDTVAWVTERKNVLSGLFWMLTSLAYLSYVRQRTVLRYGVVLLCFTLGLMSKPVLVTLPAALLLLDIWPLRRVEWARKNLQPSTPASTELSDLPTVSSSTVLLEKVPLLLLAVASSAVTILSHEGLGISQEVHGLPVGLRLENAVISYVRYLGKFLVPLRLAVLYPHPGKWPAEVVFESLFVLAAVTLVFAWQFRRRPFLLVGWLWFLGVLLPAIGILQVGIQAMADRFIYLPVVGLLIVIAWGGAEVAARFPKGTGAVASLLALVGAAAVSWVQLGYWQNSVTLWQHTVEVTQQNWIAHNNFAHTLYLARRFDEGIEQARLAAQIRPDFAEARLNLGLLIEGKGKPEEAIAYYEQAVAMHTNWPLARKHLADALVRVGRAPEAVAHYEAILSMVPGDIEARARLASLLSQQGRAAEAIAQYKQCLALNPNLPEVLNNLAWILATDPLSELRNPREAVELATRACELTSRKEPFFIGTLAAALAANAQFDEAVRVADEAATLAHSRGMTELEATNRRLGKLYGEHQTYRE